MITEIVAGILVALWVAFASYLVWRLSNAADDASDGEAYMAPKPKEPESFEQALHRVWKRKEERKGAGREEDPPST